MKIKKYTGKTFKEAFNDMKTELGEEAIILNSKKVKKGGTFDFLGGSEYYEITAAIDTPAPQTASPRRTGIIKQPDIKPGYIYTRPKTADAEKTPPPRERERIETIDTIKSTISDQRIAQQMTKLQDLAEEVQDMRKVLEQLSEFIKYSRMPALPQAFKTALRRLMDNEVHEELAKAIVQTAYARTEPQHYTNTRVVLENIFSLLRQMIRIAPPLENIKRKPYVVALVGPTGVGKTTTIAKIAANMKLLHKRDVALISADTYRIAAIEQLQTFANIAAIPMTVAYSPSEMQLAVEKYRDKHLILIDTVGRSPKNDDQLSDLLRFVDAAEPNEVHLVMSLTSSAKTMMEITEKFKMLKPNRLLFTKTDESTGPGAILNVLYKQQIPVSYLTTGQVVPNDIIPASYASITKLIYKGGLE
jgi:flagellar biosynthesis protein FlhF